MYEVYLKTKNPQSNDWDTLFASIAKLCRQGEKFELRFHFDAPSLRILLSTNHIIPYSIANLDGFVFYPCDKPNNHHPTSISFLPFVLNSNDNLLNICDKLAQSNKQLEEAIFEVRKIGWRYHLKTYLIINNGSYSQMSSAINGGLHLLNLDLKSRYILQTPPKHLNLSRTLCLADTSKISPIVELNTYPYLKGTHYLNLKSYDFYKHTVIFGASGAGKTKFISNFISEVIASYGDQYHILVIDPHDTLKDEIGGIKGVKTYDFHDSEKGLDLFLPSEQNIISSVDMSLSLLKSLIGDEWNSYLERLLRACIYLLTEKCELTFQNLRKLLTDSTYKNACLQSVSDYLPESLQSFFGQEYNEFKAQHYDITFARAIALIDELQLSPAFYRKNKQHLNYELSENKATVISLNSTKIGNTAVKAIAGLIMNQLFILGVGRKLHQHIVLIVDEVALVENPILTRLLSEARKYNITIILAGQYFAQVSSELRLAIHANVLNYFCFRLNYTDAELMSKYLNMELHSEPQTDYLITKKETFSASNEEKIKTLTSLSDRKIIMRLSRSGIILPAISGKTVDFKPQPVKHQLSINQITSTRTNLNTAPTTKLIRRKISISKTSVFDLMREQSTSRRKVS